MINKRDYFDSVVGYDKRVLNDALLLNFDEFWETSERPYFAESTTILFLTKGTITVSINSTEHEVVAPAMVVSHHKHVHRPGQRRTFIPEPVTVRQVFQKNHRNVSKNVS